MNHKKRYSRPLYKKFKQVFENVQLRKKMFKFKKKKWEALINRLKKQTLYRRKNKFFNHTGNTMVPLVAYRKTPKFKKRFKYSMNAAKKINLFYGGLKKKYFRKLVRTIWKHKTNKIKTKTFESLSFYFLNFMEKRLETVLYRSFFIQSIKSARQLILHGHIFVNNKIIKHGSYILKENDLIEINPKFHKRILRNIRKSRRWPIQLNNFIINYKTLQILYLDRSNKDNFINLFPFRINIKNVIKYYRYV